MKKVFVLKESELIKLIKNVIKESNIVGLNISDFKIIDSFDLKDLTDTIEYHSISKTKNNKPEFILKFYKKPNNDLYKVESVAIDFSKNSIGKGFVDLLDENDFTNIIGDSEIINNGKDYWIEYIIKNNNIYEFIKMIMTFLKRNNL